MEQVMYFACQECFKWCHEPKGFDERKHNVKCQCGKTMYLTHGKPEDDAMPKRDEIQGELVAQ